MTTINKSGWAVVFLLISAAYASAGEPPFINFQGRLTGPAGQLVPDGIYDFVFTIYDQPVGGNALWTSGTVPVNVQNGLFTTLLPEVVSPALIPASSERLLGIKVGDDPEMTPRIWLVTVPYAYAASEAARSQTCPEWESILGDIYRETGNVGINHNMADGAPSQPLVIGDNVSDNLYGDYITVNCRGIEGLSGIVLGESSNLYGGMYYDEYGGVLTLVTAFGALYSTMTFTDGRLGIGTSVPQVRLDVRSSGSSDGIRITSSDADQLFRVRESTIGSCEASVSDESGNTGVMLRGSGDSYFIGGEVGIGTYLPGRILQIVQNSTTDPLADAWTTYSSRRWKENIRPISHGLDKVERLCGVEYDWKADGKHDIGLIAEEVGEVVPEVVAYEENGVDAVSLDYARLVALLIEAVKELNQKVAVQEAVIAELKRAEPARAAAEVGR